MSVVLDDTIAAIATPAGEGGLAVVRMSGPASLAIADAVFRGGARPLAAAGGNTLHHGWFGAGELVDEVVAAVFRAPASYTREDVVEFSCHGGRLPATRVLERLLGAGARMARPGEFTMRAFLSGRLDLVQAEAVADLIGARNDAMHRAALARLAGEVSRELRRTLEELADLVAEVEARVDFADEVGDLEQAMHLTERILRLSHTVGRQLDGAAYGRALRDGIQVAIVGAPNAGKSSLFNRLVGEERAIVAATPGTTRDRVSATVDWDGVIVTFSDTAGLRESADEVERLGIERTRATLAEARIVLWVVDGSAPDPGELQAPSNGQRTVVALNKLDLGCPPGTESRVLCADGSSHVVRVSARTGEGMEALAVALRQAAGFSPGDVLASERQVHQLLQVRARLATAAVMPVERRPAEILAVELREAMTALEELLGVRVSDDMLERIFSKFCIGK